MKIAKSSLLIAGMLSACAVVAWADQGAGGATTAKPKNAEVSWLTDADTAGNAEVAAAQLALTKAQRADVRAFAQRMVDDHAKANKEIADLATKKGVVLAAAKPSKDLDSTTGAAFDAAYLKAQVKDHEAAEKLYEKGAKSSDADIRAFAEKTLPTVREHLAEVRRLVAIPSK